HTYSKAGKFVVTLIASKGGINSISRDTVTIKSATVFIADFKFAQDTTKTDSTVVVAFTNLSSTNATSYIWDFGDGKSSNDKDPVHTYKKDVVKDVTYTVKLQASTNGSTSQKEAPLTIKKKQPFLPKIVSA